MKKLFLVLILILFVNTGCTKTLMQNKNANLETKEKAPALIDTKDEAIAQAKKLSKGLENFSTKYGTNGIDSTAYFYEDKNYWHVSFWPTNSVDFWYIIYISPDGTMTYEGAEAGG